MERGDGTRWTNGQGTDRERLASCFAFRWFQLRIGWRGVCVRKKLELRSLLGLGCGHSKKEVYVERSSEDLFEILSL